MVRLLEDDPCEKRRIPRPIPNLTESLSANFSSAPVGKLVLDTDDPKSGGIMIFVSSLATDPSKMSVAAASFVPSLVLVGPPMLTISVGLASLFLTTSAGAGFTVSFFPGSRTVSPSAALAALARFRSCLARRRATHSGKYSRRISHFGFTSGSSGRGLLLDSHVSITALSLGGP